MSDKNNEDIDYFEASFQNKWEDYGDDKQVKNLPNVIVVAPKALKKIVVPLFCPLCNFPMTTKEDGISYRNLECCEKCEMRFGTAIKIEKKSFQDVKNDTKAWREYYVDRLKRSKNLLKLK